MTGGKKDGLNYVRSYGYDEFSDNQDVVYTKPIPFYLKTKEFKDNVLSKKKALSEIWFNYDLTGTVNLTVITHDGKQITKNNCLPEGSNKTECILIPNDIQDKNSYTFEIRGEGNLTIYAMERKYRTKGR